MKTKYFLTLLLIIGGVGNLQSQSANQNYVLSRTYTNEQGTDYLDQIQYFDGLGRPVQTIQKTITPGATPAERKDLVSLQEYDAFGRDAEVWLPAAIAGNNGAYVDPVTLKPKIISTNIGDAKPYSKPAYETSPLNRVMQQFGPGADWHNNGKAVNTGYLTNAYKSGTTLATADSLVCALYLSTDDRKTISISRSDNYKVNELYVTRLKDEDENASYEFKDKLGQIVLTRQVNGTELLNTYYVYDSYGNLRVVIPPLAADKLLSAAASSPWTETNVDLQQLAYLYKYDDRNRCIAKKLPGADWIYYVYDKADRLIFTQDGEQFKKTPKEWTFTIPDAMGRIVLTGTCTTVDQATIVAGRFNNWIIKADYSVRRPRHMGYAVSLEDTTTTKPLSIETPLILSVNYYDNYNFLTNGYIENNANTKYNPETGYGTWYGTDYTEVNMYKNKGLLTGALVAQLNGSATPSYLYSVMYYDNRGRVIQTKSNNHLAGGIEKEYIAYNFTGQPIAKKHVHSATGKTTQTEVYAYTYDHAGRLTKTTHQLNGGTVVAVAENTYDELGRLKTNKKNNQASLTSNYTYNVRSWTKSISSPLFAQTLYYNDVVKSHTYSDYKPTYGGNISGMEWKVQNETVRSNRFKYDNLSRLIHSAYNGVVSGGYYNVAYSYDKHGNMTSLARLGKKNDGTASSSYARVDALTMTYKGNQLVNINDTVSNISMSGSADFKDYTKGTGTEYLYNANGAMYKDLNKGISNIQYNSLNLPLAMDINAPAAEARTKYTYTASSVKLRVEYTWNKSRVEAPVSGSAIATIIAKDINPNNMNQLEVIDYIGNISYKNGVLQRILIDGGYIEGGTYYFYLNDHLGNNRVVANASGTVIQKNHYYPFGMAFAETPKAEQDKQPYKYNGKEFDQKHELNMYDYSARYYELALGRFTTVDPMAEKFYSISPYVYCYNNPINNFDPDGRWGIGIHYSITYNQMQKAGVRDIDLIRKTAYMASTYADMPPVGIVRVLGGYELNYGWYGVRHGQGPTANSQHESESWRHAMMSNMEAFDGMSRADAINRTIDKAWNEYIFEAFQGNNVAENLGVGLHALQDIFAHKGMSTREHLGFGDNLAANRRSSLKTTLLTDMGLIGSSGLQRANAVTQGVITLFGVVTGDRSIINKAKDKKGNINIDLQGVTNSDTKQKILDYVTKNYNQMGNVHIQF